MSAAAALAAALNAAIGESEKEQEVTAWLNTSYAPLNAAVSGDPRHGIPQGRITEIAGPSSSGKTALAQMLMVEAQRQGGVAMFFDHEQSFDIGMAQDLGLDTTPGLWVYKLPETWEESNIQMLKAASTIRTAKVIPPDAPIVAITDSLASCRPHSTVYDSKGGRKQLDELTMNDNTALARVTSQTLKHIKPACRNYGLTAIYLNQIRTKPGVVYGDPRTTPGGSAMEFYADVRLFTGRRLLKIGAEKEFVGQEIGIEVKKTKFTKPFQECDLRLMFRDDGAAYFDTAGSLIELLISQGKLPAKGWIDWEGGRYNGRAQLAEHVMRAGEVSKLVNLLYNAVKV